MPPKSPKPTGAPKKRKPTVAKKTDATPKSQLKPFLIKIAVLGATLFFVWVFYLNARVTTEFKGQLFAEPARVYAKPLSLYPGLELSQRTLIEELQRLGYRQVSTRAGSGTFWPTGNTIELVTRAYAFWDGAQPIRHLWVDFSNNRIQSIRDTDIGLVDLVRLDPLVIGSLFLGHKQDRHLLSIDEVPDLFRESLLAVEDRNFTTILVCRR